MGDGAMTLARRYLGTGFAFPLRVGPTGAIALSSGELDIEEAIGIVLGTAPGERPLRPDFGCGIHDVVFAPNNPPTRLAVEGRVRDALTRYEPRIDVNAVRVRSEPETPELLLVEIDYRVRSNNAFGNVVYPFYLREGERLP
jgi:hypothetical protein